jgi:hypothetical protein
VEEPERMEINHWEILAVGARTILSSGGIYNFSKIAYSD